jgi:streptogramin lyase
MGVVIFTDQHDHKLLALKRFIGSALVSVGGAGSLSTPGGLVLDGQGNVIIADSGNDRLAIWDLWSATWLSFGSRGAGTGQFVRPAAVAIDANQRILVVDAGNHRLVRIDDLDGNGWVTYGAPGRPTAADPVAAGLFADPRGVAVDGRGRIVVTDPAAGRAVRIDDMDGSGRSTLPLPAGMSPRQPFGVAASDEQVAISDVGNRAVHVFDLDDTRVATLDGMDEGMPLPTFTAYDGNHLVVADVVSNDLRRFRLASGAFVVEEIFRGSGPELITPRFQQIGGIASGGR